MKNQIQHPHRQCVSSRKQYMLAAVVYPNSKLAHAVHEKAILSRWYRTLLDFCPCARLIRHFGGVSEAVCTLSSAYRQALGKKVFDKLWRGYRIGAFRSNTINLLIGTKTYLTLKPKIFSLLFKPPYHSFPIFSQLRHGRTAAIALCTVLYLSSSRPAAPLSHIVDIVYL
jgi:hypothetical protein